MSVSQRKKNIIPINSDCNNNDFNNNNDNKWLIQKVENNQIYKKQALFYAFQQFAVGSEYIIIVPNWKLFIKGTEQCSAWPRRE